ncbi:hypothetical protein NMD75_02380 [Edwardsiella tarda]
MGLTRGLVPRASLSSATVYRLPSTVYRLPSTVYRLPSTVYRLPSTVYRLPSTVYQTECNRLHKLHKLSINPLSIPIIHRIIR